MDDNKYFSIFLEFSVQFFFQPIYTDYANKAYLTKYIKIFSQDTMKPNWTWIFLGWSTFKIMYVSLVLHQRWWPLLKMEISLKWQVEVNS
jgi:hypothetical protein